MIVSITDPGQKSQIAEQILTQLPDWFGVPESTRGYISGCREKPFWADMSEQGPLGFIVLKETSPATAEIYVMGVLPACHRQARAVRCLRRCRPTPNNKAIRFYRSKPSAWAPGPPMTKPMRSISPWVLRSWSAFRTLGMKRIPAKSISKQFSLWNAKPFRIPVSNSRKESFP